MAPRVRVTLAILGVVMVIAFVLTQMYLVVLSPLLQWQSERASDRAVYQTVSRLGTRADVERNLTGWKAEPSPGSRYCEILAKRRVIGGDKCRAADHEVTYRRQRSPLREAPLTPLQILVVYDRADHVIATSTLD